MKSIKQSILDRGLSSNASILIPEVNDSRVSKAIEELKAIGFSIKDVSEYLDNYDEYLEMLSKLKFCKNWPYDEIKNYLDNPINYGLIAVANGDADGLVAGATISTSDMIRKTIRIIGVDSYSTCISSIFFMISNNDKNCFTYSDCGVIPEPDSKQLVEIAYNASNFHRLLSENDPKIAFLSFSTKGSAEHYRVQKIQEAVKLFGKKHHDILHDGELQFDAAISSEVSKLKDSSSKLNGEANTFIFPNLDAGNIAYKITERLGGYTALGPLLQGLSKPVHDLSRGCSTEDIVLIAAITALQKESEIASI